MTFQETMRTLESLGTAQNRKIYARHGAGDNTFGVSFGDLYKLRKKIKTDQPLADQLWRTGNNDARSLALLIADASAMSEADLDRWVKGINYYCHADLFARCIGFKSRFSRKKMEHWTKSKDDFVSQCGWDLVGAAAMNDSGLPDSYFEQRLKTIEQDIHKANNRTRHAMNGALIGIGLRNASLRKLALAASARIGKVVVDHGETNCKSPDATAYIKKAAAYRRAKGR